MKYEVFGIENLTLSRIDELGLKQIRLNIFRNERLGITGLDRSGKSVLVRCIAGFYPDATGAFYFEDREISLKSVQHAQEQGIFYINRTPMLVPELSVSENIFSIRKHYPSHFYYKKYAALNQTQILLNEYDLDFDASCLVGELTEAQSHLLQIIKVITMGAKILILDCLTGNYDSRELSNLEKMLERLTEVTVLYVSDVSNPLLNRMERVVVMRAGRMAGTLIRDEYSVQKLILLAHGHEIEESLNRVTSYSNRFVLKFEMEGSNHTPISIKVKSGEIIGLLNLEGEHINNMISELINKKHPNLWINENKCLDYSDAIKKGLALITHNTGSSRLIASFDLKENIIFQVYPKIAKFGIVNKRMMQYIYNTYLNKYIDIKEEDNSELFEIQVLLCKWTSNKPKVMIFDNIVADLDPISKRKILQMLLMLAEEGIGILFLSTSLSDCFNLCHKVQLYNYNGFVVELDTSLMDYNSYFEYCSKVISFPKK